ncbi:ABC transporter, ATP-binding protein [Bulleidia extructa W1219]|uniref:ABC transporter, ATP-binding protein n=1 Tax=Bulleidia extructa W1219 TaxID=679192 RepID=D2MNE7_9FIRM|nr:ABC transporter ATP-binding protein [Bulleidia extructa]EFC05969.1 ABC transporter, ATP-binding protein [Bulleidia extructa W1219]
MSVIKIDRLSFKYDKEILKNISVDIEAGAFVSLLGINGAGKSTLLKNLNQILSPYKGTIYIRGENLKHMKRSQLAKKMAYVSQQNEAPQNTVFDSILIGRVPYIKGKATKEDYAIVQEIIGRLNLNDYAMREATSLSGGEFQKVVLARALAQEPEILLLDEPTSNLDIRNQVEVMKLMKQYCKDKQISVIVSIHDMNLSLQFSDKYLMLKDGEVFKYGSKEIITRENIRTVYGLDVDILKYKNRKIVILN